MLGKGARSRLVDASGARDTYGIATVPVSKGIVMPTVSAHVAVTLARHIDHVFGVMGNGNAYFLDALERETAVDVHRDAPRGRRGRRRRRLPPRVRRPRRRDRDLRRRASPTR